MFHICCIGDTMKLTSFLMAGLLVASCGIVATGCNENPTDTPSTGSVGTPSSLKATSVDASSVRLAWNAPNDTAIASYMISYSAQSTVDSSQVTVTPSSTVGQLYTVTNLKPGVEYRFYVRAVRGSDMSSAATVNWAGASRYSDDGARTLRMYEFNSDKGSGLLLDPTIGSGPRMASAKTEPGNVQLAWLFKAAGTAGNAPNAVDSVIVGAAPAFPEFSNRASFYQNVYISGSTFFGTSLSDIFPDRPLDQLVLTDTNTRAFALPAAQPAGIGQGFYVRIGTSSATYHYARVFIRNNGTNLVQGSSPDRYIQIDVSYQQTANLPFAKPAGKGYPQVGYRSRIGL